MDKESTLKSSVIFSGLSAAELNELAGLAIFKEFTAGAYIFREEDPAEWFYIIASGRIKVTRSTSLGKELIVAFFGSGELFGEVAAFSKKPYPASAIAVEPTQVISIKRDTFTAFLGHYPQVALQIINVLGLRLRDAQGRISDLVGERVEQRLARILLMLYTKLGTDLPFTRQEIADMSGTTVETAIRFMSRLRTSGIIRSGRGKITISDVIKLRLLSEGPPRVQ